MNSSLTIKSWPIYPFLRYSLLLLGLLSLSRLILAIWLLDRVGSAENLLTVMLFGLRFDLIIVCVLWFIPAMLLLLLPKNRILKGLFSSISRLWLMLTSIVILFLELSTPAFIDQYDTRPNRLYFEYLETPVEVLKTSVYEYPWHVFAAFILITILSVYLLRLNRKLFAELQPWSISKRLILLPLLLAVLIIGARSSFDHRPANPSIAAFSNDQLVNKLGLSSAYTLLTAVYNLRHENSATSAYGEIPDEQMVALVRQKSFIDASAFVDDPVSSWHQQTSATPESAKNLVIILQESLGAGYVGSLGGIGVTPEIDKLSRDGLWFTRLYATGTRSARGIEAVIAGFPPSPSRSVLKLGKAQQNFATLASILKGSNYDTQFIYGGESHFDNMAGFFLANGFDRVTDQNDYANPMFRATWGVSDEDLLQRLDQELMIKTSQAKFILAFSSSNHSPFEFPDGRIELHDAEKHTVNNAIKYADFAVGEFFRTAKTRDYWENSIFLLVSDHDTRVTGASLVPVNKFHIPGLIIGPGIKPAHYDKIASQIDLAPTLLDLLGVSSKHPMIGQNLRQLPQDFPGRALMQYGNNHAYLQGDDLVIHIPEKPPKQFVYRDRQLIETALDAQLAKTALAHLLWPMYAYREQKYLYQR